MKSFLSSVLIFRTYNIINKIIHKVFLRYKNPFVRYQRHQIFEELDHKGQIIDPKIFGNKPKELITDIKIENNDIINNTKKINSIDVLTNDEISNSIFYI